MVAFPHAKINLGLHVIRRRDDGYHDIETCFYPVPLTDILEVVPSDTFSFSVSGIEVPGSNDDNLCVKAYHMLVRDHGIGPAAIHLHKIIPTGAGLGGGSSDAAFALRVISEVFGRKLSREALADYASQLGSDCAFFLHDRPMMGTDRGDNLRPADVSLKGRFMVIVTPPVHIATADAYRLVKPSEHKSGLTATLAMAPITEWKQLVKNDFEDPVFSRYPAIKEVKETLYRHGAIYASLSGSGASVFGIFGSAVDLSAHFPGKFYWGGELTR